MLKDLLESLKVESELVDKIIKAMQEQKIYTTAEENLDVRYKKLKDQSESKDTELNEAQKLIKELQTLVGDSESVKSKVGEYEKKIDLLQKQNEKLALESAVTFELQANKAKSDAIEFLLFKVLNDESEITMTDKGKLKGLDIDEIKKNHASMFDNGAGNLQFQGQKLPENNNQNDGMTQEEFNKLGITARFELLDSDPETFKKFANKESE